MNFRTLLIAFTVCMLPHVAGISPVHAENASAAMTQLAGGIPGERHEIAVQLTSTFTIPSLPELQPITATGDGAVEYYLSGQVIRFRSNALPAMTGALTTREVTYQLHLTGQSNAIGVIRWGHGNDITLEGLGLRGRATQGDQAIARTTQTEIQLTTGTITVDGITYRGKIDLAQQRVVLVGTFPMPPTGIAGIDTRLAGKAVVLRLAAAPQAVL